VNVGGQTYSLGDSTTFEADSKINPNVSSITPNTALPVFGGINITIAGTNLKNGDKETSVIIGDDYCKIKSVTDTQIICTIPKANAGRTVLIVEVEEIGGSNVNSIQYGSKVKVQLGEDYSCQVASVSNTEIECETEGASSTVTLDNSGLHNGNES